MATNEGKEGICTRETGSAFSRGLEISANNCVAGAKVNSGAVALVTFETTSTRLFANDRYDMSLGSWCAVFNGTACGSIVGKRLDDSLLLLDNWESVGNTEGLALSLLMQTVEGTEDVC